MITPAVRERFRRELGLPESGRIVMTGHQCAVWHAGILAKYLACDRMTESPPPVPLVGRPRTTSAPGSGDFERQDPFDHAAWLWVDQDTDETHTLRVPVRKGERLAVAEWRLHDPPSFDKAASSVPAFRPAPFTGEAALLSVHAGIGAIINALRQHESEPNAARQTAAAVADLMSVYLKRPPRPQVFATDLMRTELGGLLIAKMRDDPRACVEHYNNAVFANPQAGIASLATGDADADAELPLWLLAPASPRRRVFARDLRDATLDPRNLAPRALLMTGLIRAAACDLFIHGTGGGVYDTITEAWFRNWLGIELAPTIVVTADLLLPLHPREVTERDVAAAKWQAHHARHDPAMLGDPAAAKRKSELVAAIAAAREHGEDPLPNYRTLHAALAASRQEHAAKLESLAHAATEAESMFAERAIASDRAWPFPFHDAAAIQSMTIKMSSVAEAR